MFKQRKILIGTIVLLCAVFLGFYSLKTPKKADSRATGFSAVRASEDIRQIAAEPHSVRNQEALSKVRDYLVRRIDEMGLESEVFTYKNHTDKYGWTYDVNNIYTKIDGKDGEDGTYILLVAHYDSSPAKRSGEEDGSTGAADDGYGVATVLEILELLTQNQDEMVNGVKVLFTDAEETGLVGASKEMEYNRELYDNVSYVINVEARGITGPAIMFETTDQNVEVMDLYSNANFPVAYSLASDVYRKMPNGSDFTEFKDAGLVGINFAVLKSLDYYHTTNDNYDNIDFSTLQHYGEQILPIVEAFVYDEKYSDPDVFKSDQNAVFFTFLPNVLVMYSTTFANILTGIFLIGLLVVTLILVRSEKVSLKHIALWLMGWLSISVIMMGVGYVISLTVAAICNIEFKLFYMPKVPNADLIVLLTVLVFFMMIWWIVCTFRKSDNNLLNVLLGGVYYNTMMLIIFTRVLPGGTFLFTWPLIASLVPLALVCIDLQNNDIYKYASLIPFAVTIIIFVPVLYLINIALTIGALAGLLFFASFAISIIVPCSLIFLNDNRYY